MFRRRLDCFIHGHLWLEGVRFEYVSKRFGETRGQNVDVCTHCAAERRSHVFRHTPQGFRVAK